MADHIQPILEELHWLPVKQGILFESLAFSLQMSKRSSSRILALSMYLVQEGLHFQKQQP